LQLQQLVGEEIARYCGMYGTTVALHCRGGVVGVVKIKRQG
jgi:hypothetical protein